MEPQALDPSEKAPPPQHQARPRFWRFYRDRNLTGPDVARVFGRTREWVRRISLPFHDPNRLIPALDDVERIHAWSDGEIGPADWYPPQLSGPEATAEGSATGLRT